MLKCKIDVSHIMWRPVKNPCKKKGKSVSIYYHYLKKKMCLIFYLMPWDLIA